MNLYNIVLFAHVFGVLTLFMAVAIETLCLHRMRGAVTTDQLREWASLTKVTDKLLPFGTMAILVSGLYMALTTWDVTVPWISMSLAVVAVMFVVGPAVNSRRLDAIAAAARMAPPGPIPAALASRIHDPILLASIHILAALGFGVVFLKAVRPDLPGALGALVVAIAVGILSARLATRGRVADEAPALSSQIVDERL